MEFYQVINNLRNVRDLTAEPISADVLERIVAAGIQDSGSMRIPVENEGLQVAETVHATKDYMLPCYIGLGYLAKNAAVLE